MVKLKVRVSVGHVQCFDQSSFIMTFSEGKFKQFFMMNIHLSYCRFFSDFLLFHTSRKTGIFLADRLELWTNI